MLSKDKSIRIRSRGYTDRIQKFAVGDLVWLFIPATKKINLNWHGPFSIIRLIGNACFVIQPVLVAGREMLVHISCIRKCTANISDIREHLGVSDPSHEQQLDLFSDLETVEGYNLDDIVYDDADDIDYNMPHPQDIPSDSVSQPQTQVSSPVVSVPI